jgi:transposase-like protein
MKTVSTCPRFTPKQREAFQSKLATKTRREVAAECGVTPQAIKKRWSRLRKKLRAAGFERQAALMSAPAARRLDLSELSDLAA